MRKNFAAILAYAFMLVATTAVAQESTLDVVKKRGTLIAGMRNDFPPAAYVNQQGEWVGFEIDLMEYIAKKLGVKLQKEVVTSRTRIPVLVNGNVDVAMAVMNPTRNARRSSILRSRTFSAARHCSCAKTAGSRASTTRRARRSVRHRVQRR